MEYVSLTSLDGFGYCQRIAGPILVQHFILRAVVGLRIKTNIRQEQCEAHYTEQNVNKGRSGY